MTIRETLISIDRAIRQFGFPVRVYIHDDGSKDDSLNIARNAALEEWKFPDHLIIKKNDKNQGERKTTNEAFEYFFGKYDWAFIIHADDIVKEEWLSSVYDQIRNCDADEFFTIWSSFDSLDNRTGKITPGDNSGKINIRKRSREDIINYLTQLYSNWHISGAAFNVSLYKKLNGFDVSMAQFGDTDFFVRGLLAGYQDIYISRTLTFYRTFPGSVSAVSVRTNRDIKEIYMLMHKFNSILGKNDLKKMYGLVRKMSSRRMIKSLMHFRLKSAVNNGYIYWDSSYKQLHLKKN